MIKMSTPLKLQNRQQLQLTDILTGSSIIVLKFSSFDLVNGYERNTQFKFECNKEKTYF